jgi:hypothetical protein
MNKRILHKKVRDVIIRADIHMLSTGCYTLAQAKRNIGECQSPTHRRRFRLALRATSELLPSYSFMDHIFAGHAFRQALYAAWPVPEVAGPTLPDYRAPTKCPRY